MQILEITSWRSNVIDRVAEGAKLRLKIAVVLE
jgi:hypothetical protein